MIADRECERERVLNYDRITADVSFASEATELMHSRVRADVGAVVNNDVAGEGGRVGHDHVITDDAVVGDVTLRHQKTVVTDLCDAAAAFGAAMNSDELANARATAYLCFGLFAGELQILRWQADRDERVDVSFIANARLTINHAMRVDAYAAAERDVRADRDIGANVAAVAKLSTGTHYRTR